MRSWDFNDLGAGPASGTTTALALVTMFDAIKKDNARYAAFAASMVESLAAEIADIAARDARFASRQIVAASVDSSAATVRPVK